MALIKRHFALKCSLRGRPFLLSQQKVSSPRGLLMAGLDLSQSGTGIKTMTSNPKVLKLTRHGLGGF